VESKTIYDWGKGAEEGREKGRIGKPMRRREKERDKKKNRKGLDEFLPVQVE